MWQLTGSYRSARQRTSRSRTVNSDVKGCVSGEVGRRREGERVQGLAAGQAGAKESSPLQVT
jgi:hypothetical protein